MNRLILYTLIFSGLWLHAGADLDAATSQNRYIALSLKEAEQALQNPANEAKARKLAGITRPIALVTDETTGDVIIVGEVKSSAAPLTLDDWAVALRAAFKENHLPLVSIDLTPETKTTQMQTVHFEGGIANTPMGKDMLAADVALKNMGLALLETPAGVQSYATIVGDRWRQDGQENPISSRFWFVASDQSVVVHDPGVAYLAQLDVRVRTEFKTTDNGVAPPDAKDEEGELFASAMSDHINEAGTKIPAFGRLDSIFRLSGLTQAMASWRNTAPASVPDISFWLDRYQVATAKTPEQFDLLHSHPFRREGSEVELTISGGIDTTMLLSEWKAESRSALKALVLLARPSANALSWSVPLDEQPNLKAVAALAKSPLSKLIHSPVWSTEGMYLQRIFSHPNGTQNQPIAPQPVSQTASSQIKLLSGPSTSGASSPQSGQSFSMPGNGPNAVQNAKIVANLLGPQTRVSLQGSISSTAAQALRSLLPNLQTTPPASLSYWEQHNQATATVVIYPNAVNSSGRLANTSATGSLHPSPITGSTGSTMPQVSNGTGSSPGGIPSMNHFGTRVGGVMLRDAAEAADADSELTAGDFSLIFDGGKNEIDVASLRRFVTALWATYFTEVGPGISIDPVGKMTDRHAVRYIGNVVNSDLGRVMREADYMMKSWAVGSSRPDVPKWMTPEDYAHEQGVFHLARSRFWFVPENMVFRRAGDGLMFESGRMRVKTEYMLSVEESAAKEKDGSKQDGPGKSPENEKWAEQFTRRYGELAAKYPVFDELYEYARQVSLAKYLKQSHIPLLWFMLANREMVLTEDSPGTVEAFARKSKYIHEIEIAGGVDLAPSLSEGRFVVDEKLAALLNAARAAAPEPSPKDGTPSPRPQVDVVNEGPENLTVAPSKAVVISDSADGGDFVTDLGMRIGKEPGLELARFRRSDQPQVQTFGRDWHLLIPYSIRPGSPKRIPFAKAQVPETMILRNLLSGREETFHFDDQKYKIAGYIPDDPATNLNIGLFFLNDGSYRLADKLGCQFEFDHAGRLTEMLLEDHYHISYHYGERTLTWKDFQSQPYRLTREGAEYVTLNNVRFPARLRLFDEATGEEELFAYAADNAEGIAGYMPEAGARSGYRILAILSDASFLLKHRSGAEFAFNTAGEFQSQLAYFLESMRQNNHEVAFKYDIVAHQYRIVSAEVKDIKAARSLYSVDYTYSEDGKLEESTVAAIPNPDKPDKTEPKPAKSAANPVPVAPVAAR